VSVHSIDQKREKEAPFLKPFLLFLSLMVPSFVFALPGRELQIRNSLPPVAQQLHALGLIIVKDCVANWNYGIMLGFYGAGDKLSWKVVRDRPHPALTFNPG
jgi:hypothetical protein